MTIKLPRAVSELVVAHARDAMPDECCGVLLGTAAEVVAAVPARNIADRPHRFLIDPKDHIDARRTAHRRGLEVVGFYHSHPHSDPYPSPTDKAEATYPDAISLIVSLKEGPPRLRAFVIGGDGCVEELEVEAESVQ